MYAFCFLLFVLLGGLICRSVCEDLFNNFSDIPVYADSSVGDLTGAECLASVDAGIGSVGIPGSHLQEWVFDDDRCIISDTELEKQYLLSLSRAQEVCVALRCRVPALVLDKFII